jgi:hypothetical protein
MFGDWLKALAKETWAFSLFFLGVVSNLVTFFFSGLNTIVLRDIGLALLAISFLWANFNVYKRFRGKVAELSLQSSASISEARSAVAAQVRTSVE